MNEKYSHVKKLLMLDFVGMLVRIKYSSVYNICSDLADSKDLKALPAMKGSEDTYPHSLEQIDKSG